MNIGKNIKQYREAKEMSQRQLAAVVGISQPTIAMYERGTKNPTVIVAQHTLTTYYESSDSSPVMDGEQIRKNYKLEQQQRAKEREIRKWKRMQEATDDPMMKEVYAKKVRLSQADLRSFISENKEILRRDPWRELTYGVKDETVKDRVNKNDLDQFNRYKERIGNKAPATFEDFQKLKYSNSAEWIDTQTEYRYQGIIDRLVEKNKGLRVFNSPDEIPDEYNLAARGLSNTEKDGLYNYSKYETGVKMNMSLGGVKGISLTPEEQQHLLNTEKALNKSSLPYDTVLWRGTESKLLNGFDSLPERVKDWVGKPLFYKGFSSTSLVKNASYIAKSNKNVELVLIKRANQNGATYIEEISYNRANNLSKEYEVLLQKQAKYRIIEAQKFKGKYIITAEVL